jgi:glycosyltransferase involved in cell wall biosynthesis
MSSISTIQPQITVIIPAYRRRNYLFYALDRILAQKDVTLEILVFSEVMEPDEVDEVAEAYPQVRYFKTDKYQGASNKRRAGVKMAKGKYLYLPDDDDYLTDETFFKRAIEILDKDDSLALVAADTIIKHEFKDASRNYEERRKNDLEGKIDGIDYLQGLQFTMNKPQSSVSILFRKQALVERDVDAMFEISDIAMYMNALLWGDAFIIKDPVAVYRFHDGNLTYSLPYSFMYNVIREKERVYKDARKELPHPDEFWYQHFRISYFFFKDGCSSIRLRLKFLFWGLVHAQGNISLIRFIIKQLGAALLRRR